MIFKEDFVRSAEFYGSLRTARFMFAHKRGRGIYNRAFEDSKSIFIHVPKAAGSSVARSLYEKERGHYPAFLYRCISPTKFHKYFTFGIVRNPWDRLVSAFHYLKQGGKISADKSWADAYLLDTPDFDTFVRTWLNSDRLFTGVHFWPQSFFLCDRAGKIIVDFVGKFENLDADYELIRSRLDVAVELRSDNRSVRTGYTNYYTDETAAKVADLYATDISLFNYSFGN